MELSKILIIGATGRVGQHIAKASLALGHPTFLLLRDSPTPDQPMNSQRQELINSFKDLGAVILKGCLEDYESLLEAIKQVEVVISAVGHHGYSHSGTQLADQARIVEAIQEAGNIKRFLPSEFGMDVDRDLNSLTKSVLLDKVHIRRAIENAGIPYTVVSANNLFRPFLDERLPKTVQMYNSLPKEEMIIFGDGNTKAIYVAEEDVAAYTIYAVDDIRTVNKVMYIRPPKNTLSQNELVQLWEQKIGESVAKVYVSEEEIQRQIRELPYPQNLYMAFGEDLHVKGVEVQEIGEGGVEACGLYSDKVHYTTVDKHLDSLKLHLSTSQISSLSI